MPAKARKGFKNGHTNRSSLVKMQTNKNIIKPCFLEAASHEALMFQAGRNWLPRFQNGCQQKFPLARKVKSAGADFGLLTLRPETFRWHQPPIFALFCP
jgi:hypothetical protein